MLVAITLAFAAGALSCLLVERLFWPRAEPQRRGRDGRFVRERPMSATERSRRVGAAFKHASRETGAFGPGGNL